jgi:hypothetical protein
LLRGFFFGSRRIFFSPRHFAQWQKKNEAEREKRRGGYAIDVVEMKTFFFIINAIRLGRQRV